MRKSRLLPLMLLAALSLTAGCYTAHSGRSKSRYRENPGSFTDQAARSAYIEQRSDELMRRGLSRKDAAAQAANDWFSQAPVPTASPTRDELDRREAESDFSEYVRKSKKEAGGN